MDKLSLHQSAYTKYPYHLSELQNREPVSSKSVDQLETEILLEELAELIESEGGILTP